ncbi:MAG: hypothetical protein FJ288_06555 [Planctomycetes bacterium]|nr:hypothetical protein [Planctomycetota bacterium]
MRHRFLLFVVASALAPAGAAGFGAAGLGAAGAVRAAEPDAAMLRKALAGPMAGAEEIVFAVRGLGGDGHWYANFGYHVSSPQRMQYGPPGGRLCRLNLRTGRVQVILDDPQGGVRDPCVHYDGRRIVFSYRPGDSTHYHLYEINADGTGLRQLTDGDCDEVEPIYLPDGDLVFGSSRCNRWVQCWFTQVAILHRSDADGRSVRPISANVEQDNTPWMMPDGRLLYMRWEYVDRSRVQFHHLWTVNPDGTGQMAYFGNMHPGTVMLDAKPIPGSDKVVTLFSPGHGRKEHAGHITVVSADAGPDAQPMARRITPEAEWRDPWAFSEDCFMAARDCSLYVLDGRGRAEEFYRLPPQWRHLAVHEPRPLVARPREPVIPPRVNWSAPTGRLVLADVTHGRSMEGVRPGEVRRLLVLETLPKPVNFSGTMEPISLDGTFTLPRILGTVPVEPDGSAYFEVPALRPVFFVALDENDLSVKRMQSFVSVMPGETTGCTGCHENRTDVARARPLAALGRAPSRIEPIDGVPQVFDFPRDIQPILDRRCVRCHNYEKPDGRVVLTGDRGPIYSHAYATLMARGLVAHGRDAQGNRPPRSIGSSASRLIKLLDGSHYDARLTPHEVRLVRLWIESGAPYPGTYAALGTGMVSVGFDAGILERRCTGCHGPPDPNPKKKAAFGTHEELLWNLSRPVQSLALLAPLAKAAAGMGLCKTRFSPDKVAPAGPSPPVFADTQDADYQRLLAAVAKAGDELERIRRFDMPGFQPNQHYVREMQRYGILPAALAPAQPIDPYATDLAYWKSFWYEPPLRQQGGD